LVALHGVEWRQAGAADHCHAIAGDPASLACAVENQALAAGARGLFRMGAGWTNAYSETTCEVFQHSKNRF
jgi:hypothetical protein